MSPSGVLTKVIILALALLLMIPATALAGDDDGNGTDDQDAREISDDESDDDEDAEDKDERKNETGSDTDSDHSRPTQKANRSDDRPGRGNDKDDKDKDEDEDETDDDRRGQGRGRGGDKDRDDDEDDDEAEERRSVSQSTRRQVGHFQSGDSTVNGRFVTFTIADGGVSDFTYRDHLIFTTIAFDPALHPEEIESKGAEFKAEGDDAEFKAVDTPSAHFKAEAEDGTITLTLGPGFEATFVRDRGGNGNEKLRIEGQDLVAFLHGDDLVLTNGTITSEEEVRFTMHAPALRGHLAAQIGAAAADGRLAGEVLVTNGTQGDDVASVPYGPYNLSVERGARNVTVTIEGHGNGSTLLFDIERDAIGGVDDMVILFDGKRIHAADGLDDVLETHADEAPEYIIIVGGNKTQVLVSIPHFSVHTISLSSAGPVAIIQPLLGSPLVALAAAAVAAVFVGATLGIRNRQR